VPLLALLRSESRRQRAPPRAPAGRGPTDARHSRHARSRSHHGHRAATVTSWITPGGWQAAVRHDTVVSRRRRRHATAASS